jgi:glycine betaine catabolism A
MRTTLPARYYTDPAHFERELEHFFVRHWICAGRVAEVPSPGDYVLRDVGGESVIVLRTRTGLLRAYFNVCRHRGTRMCDTPHGTFAGGSIQCPYHAWTYDLEGRLIGAPHMDDVDGFNRNDYPLTPAAIDTWDGHLFLHLGLDADGRPAIPPPLAEGLGPLVERFRPWGMADLRLAHRTTYDVRANWKLVVQNYNECLHCPVLHPLLNRMHDYLGAENVPSGPGYCGGAMRLEDGCETLSTDGRRRRAFLPGLGEAERRLVSYFTIYPNLLLSLHPDYMVTVTLWPLAPDRTRLVCEWHAHPQDMARPDFVIEDAVEFWDATNREDWHISERTQLGLASRAYRPGPYSTREGQLADFDAIIRALHDTNPSACPDSETPRLSHQGRPSSG